HEHMNTHHHAGLQDIYAMIEGLKLTEEEKEDIRHIYLSIAEAEGKVHGREVSDIHFHEVGRADALADIAGCVMLMHELKPERVVVSPINVGFGEVRCAHGILPVPAPATALLLQGIPCYAGRIEGELCTPTGAALLRYFADEFRHLPIMRIEKTGYGMGKKDFAAANCVRAILGESEEDAEQVTELCCNLDDMTPEELGYASELLLEQGALEVFTTPVGMKKSRPGILLTLLCKTKEKQKFAELLFKHTTTIGIREHTCNRMVLKRSQKQKQIAGSTVRIKVSEGYGVTKEKPEYEDLKKLAEETGLSIRELKQQL
ncbi:MAG: nickel pincer cofactor biosynthesis protein LarC, partial [Lachnospiraceae bacterium]|nr:nickel pincer cofactor biosynthesis protein LarC [Lachnospiraceae bacterium]